MTFNVLDKYDNGYLLYMMYLIKLLYKDGVIIWKNELVNYMNMN